MEADFDAKNPTPKTEVPPALRASWGYGTGDRGRKGRQDDGPPIRLLWSQIAAKFWNSKAGSFVLPCSPASLTGLTGLTGRRHHCGDDQGHQAAQAQASGAQPPDGPLAERSGASGAYGGSRAPTNDSQTHHRSTLSHPKRPPKSTSSTSGAQRVSRKDEDREFMVHYFRLSCGPIGKAHLAQAKARYGW